MEFLTIAQTIYYLVISLAVIVLGILSAIVVYHLIHIARHLRNISDDLDETSDELKVRLENVIERLASLPILGYFLKENKGRAVHRRPHKKK